jgi:hypothetical protein
MDANYYKMRTRLWSGYNYTLDEVKSIASEKVMSPVGQCCAACAASLICVCVCVSRSGS